MSPQVSRRLGRVANLPPIIRLSPMERVELDRLAYQLAEFTDLPERYQRLIIEAEVTRDHLIAEAQASASA